MFYMQSCFDLRKGLNSESFREALARLGHHLRERNLVLAIGPLGRRVRHPVMDTDEVRDQEFCFLMTFEDQVQCDRAVELFQSGATDTNALHRAVYAGIENHVFYCWEDGVPP